MKNISEVEEQLEQHPDIYPPENYMGFEWKQLPITLKFIFAEAAERGIVCYHDKGSHTDEEFGKYGHLYTKFEDDVHDPRSNGFVQDALSSKFSLWYTGSSRNGANDDGYSTQELGERLEAMLKLFDIPYDWGGHASDTFTIPKEMQ